MSHAEDAFQDYQIGLKARLLIFGIRQQRPLIEHFSHLAAELLPLLNGGGSDPLVEQELADAWPSLQIKLQELDHLEKACGPGSSLGVLEVTRFAREEMGWRDIAKTLETLRGHLGPQADSVKAIQAAPALHRTPLDLLQAMKVRLAELQVHASSSDKVWDARVEDMRLYELEDRLKECLVLGEQGYTLVLRAYIASHRQQDERQELLNYLRDWTARLEHRDPKDPAVAEELERVGGVFRRLGFEQSELALLHWAQDHDLATFAQSQRRRELLGAQTKVR